MALLKQYKVNGKKVRFCDSNCAESFREDRKHGIIYPAVTDENGKLWSWTDAANDRNFCAYCKRFPEDDEEVKATFDPFDVNCFHGKEGSRFVVEWETDEDGAFGPETVRYIETQVSPMYNGGYRFVFQGKLKADKFYIFPHEIQSIKIAGKD